MAQDHYLHPYRQSIAQRGPSFESTLWASEKSQQIRFDLFAQICFLPGKRILDAGCGRGDLAAYLLDKQIDFDAYVGVDGLPEFVQFAQARSLPRCQFVAGDLLASPQLFRQGNPQVICISGTLNTMTDSQVLAFLTSAWQATDQTLLFNFLPDTAGDHAVEQTGPARRLSSLQLIQWATEQTWQVVFHQDYFPQGHDATILMHKS